MVYGWGIFFVSSHNHFVIPLFFTRNAPKLGMRRAKGKGEPKGKGKGKGAKGDGKTRRERPAAKAAAIPLIPRLSLGWLSRAMSG